MAGDLIFLSKEDSSVSDIVADKVSEMVGIRGYYIEELARLGLPIAPAVVIPAGKVANILNDRLLAGYIDEAVDYLQKRSGRILESRENPLYLKIMLSPNFDLPVFSSLHNVGLNTKSVPVYQEKAGHDFVLGEWENMLGSVFDLLAENGNLADWEEIKKRLAGKSNQDKVTEYLKLNPQLDDPKVQINLIIKNIYQYFTSNSYNKDIGFSIILQTMVYGSWGDDSLVGRFTTRNISTGEATVVGKFAKNIFSVDVPEADVKPIDLLPKEHLTKINECTALIEDKYKEVREVNFVVESGNFWIVDQKSVKISTAAQLMFLLDLRRKKKIDDKFLIAGFQPKQMRELLHAQIKSDKTSGHKFVGGIAGSPGAACGRVYLSTDSFLKAEAKSRLEGKEAPQILAMSATYAEDVQAIELGQGVISSEGGFSSHAPVVARSFGKPALVVPEIKFFDDYIMLPDGTKISEGEYVSIEVSFDKKPVIYHAQLELELPDIEKNGLKEFVGYLKNYTSSFKVRCNADQAKDALLGQTLGSSGIGLCRTEHMFFEEVRMMRLRQVLVADSMEEKLSALEAIKQYQKEDFKDIFKTLAGDPFTVRLLDAPLHEFLPKNNEDYEHTYKYFNDHKWTKKSKAEVFESLKLLGNEINPMLGHRGCRVGITNPEIYYMQVLALLEAAVEVSDEVKIDLEIMIPMITLERELDFIINGKEIEGSYIPGLIDAKKDVLKKYNLSGFKFSVKFGTMIELPGAALNADRLAGYASFFSFGTNDLTQTALGMSRDDINSFYFQYSKFDLFEFNPFQVLNDVVKDLVIYASKLGRLVRPDIKLGLCGEHGADPDSVSFCIDRGLDYVSCSPYAVPVALLTVAKRFCV